MGGHIINEEPLTMNSGKTFHDDYPATEMSGFQGGMLSTAALTIVLLPNHTPGQALGLQEMGCKGLKHNSGMEKKSTRQFCGSQGNEVERIIIRFKGMV